ncbi:MAG: hypothetical protein NTY22_06585 [Proteobacteria bacterium]|nr:hypothetical protein [Pseudomonadota bacterium]
MKPSYKRRIYLINKDFQIKFIVYTLLLSIVTIAIFYGMVYFFFEESITLGVNAGFPAGHVYYKFIEDSRADMNTYFIIASIVVFIVIFVSGLFFSHRIAGPIYRMNMYLRSIATENLATTINFRKMDFFQELAISYNKRILFLRKLATEKPEKLIELLKFKKGEKVE